MYKLVPRMILGSMIAVNSAQAQAQANSEFSVNGAQQITIPLPEGTFVAGEMDQAIQFYTDNQGVIDYSTLELLGGSRCTRVVYYGSICVCIGSGGGGGTLLPTDPLNDFVVDLQSSPNAAGDATVLTGTIQRFGANPLEFNFEEVIELPSN